MLLYSQVKDWARARLYRLKQDLSRDRLIDILEPPQTHHPSQARGISAWTALRIKLA
jgi:hypothetical protein